MKNGTTPQSYRGNNGGIVIQPPRSVDAHSHCGKNHSTKDDDARHGVRRSTRPFSSSLSSLLMSSRDLHDDEEDVNVDNDTGDSFPVLVPQPQATAITATIMARCVRAFLVLILTTTTGAVGILNNPLPVMATTPTLLSPSAPLTTPTATITKVPIEAPTGVSSSTFSVAAAAGSVSSSGFTGAASSVEAARLLLETPAKQIRIPTKVRHQILEQLQQQDTRLADCEGREDDTWEQCFYYGKQGGAASTQDNNNDAPFLTPLPPSMLTPDMVGSRIPTW